MVIMLGGGGVAVLSGRLLDVDATLLYVMWRKIGATVHVLCQEDDGLTDRQIHYSLAHFLSSLYSVSHFFRSFLRNDHLLISFRIIFFLLF